MVRDIILQKRKLVKFSDLKEGATLLYNGVICIKIPTVQRKVKNTNGDGAHIEIHNVVTIGGQLEWLDNEWVVEEFNFDVVEI